MTLRTDIHVMREAVVKVTRTLAEKGVTVTQIGSRAYCRLNDKTGKLDLVNIPQIPDNATREFIRAIHGFIDHELGHVLFSDFPTMTKFMKGKISKLGQKGAQGIIGMHNMVEDVFVEKKMRKLYRGSIDNLNDVSRFVCNEHVLPAVKQLMDAGQETEATVAMLMPAIRHIGGDPSFDSILKEFPELAEKLAKKLEPFEDDIRNADSTQDCISTATKIYNRMKEEKPPEPEEEEPKEEEGKAKPDNEDEKDEKEKSKAQDEESEKESDEDEKDEADKSKSMDDPEAEDEEDENDEDDDEDEGEGEGEGDDEEGDDESSGDSDGDEEEQEGEDEGSEGKGDDESDDSGDEESDEEGDGDGSGGDSEPSSASDDGDEQPDSSDAGGVGAGDDFSFALNDEDMETLDGIEESMSAALTKSIEEMYKNTRESDMAYVPFSSGADYTGPYVPSPYILDSHMDSVDDLITNARRKSHVLQSDFERLFAAQTATFYQPGLRKGKLNPTSLHRLLTKDDRVFRQKIDSRSTETAVSLVIDLSGSMHGKKMKLAMLSALIFGKLLDHVNITNEIIGFTTQPDERHPGATERRAAAGRINTEMRDFREEKAEGSGGYYDSERAMERFSRWEALATFIFKSYTERLTREREIGMGAMAFDGSQMNNNADGDSILIAAERLMMRPEKRKVMIVLSDGYPAVQGPPGSVSSHLHNVIRDVKNAGVEMFGIGICSDSVSTFYPDYVVLNEADELPKIILGKMRDYLLN